MKSIDYKIPLLILLSAFLTGGFIGNACSLIDLQKRVVKGEVVIEGEGAFLCERYKYNWELSEGKNNDNSKHNRP